MSGVRAPLLPTTRAVARREVHETVWWRAVHAFAFCLGGVTFLIGSALLFAESTPTIADAVGFNYTVGSLGFLTVDVLEFFTFTKPRLLRANIFASASGSLAYVLGSVGFIPVVANATGPDLGNWGFIVGSFLIAVSQTCKVIRIARSNDEPSRLTATGVEGGAGLGALFFLVGTVLALPQVGGAATTVYALWVVGSVAFLVGGLFLAGRHCNGL